MGPSARSLRRRLLLLLAILFALPASLAAWWYLSPWLFGRRRLPTPHPVVAIAYSPDGKTFATSADRGVTVLDRATRQPTFTLGDNSGFVGCVAYSPDGKLLAAASKDGNLLLWDVARREKRETPDDWELTNVVGFSPDGRTVAVGHYEPSYPHGKPGSLRLWDLPSRTRTHVLAGHPAGVKAVAFSPDGKWLASGDAGGLVKLWDVATGELRRDLPGERGTGIEGLAFGPGTGLLAYGGGWSRRFTVWDDAVTGERPRILDQGQSFGYLTCLAFAPDGRTLAVGWHTRGFFEPGVVLWDAATGTRTRSFRCPGEVRALAFAPDGTELAAGCSGAGGEVVTWPLGGAK